MRMVDVIAKKRDGKELTTAEIDWFITEYTAGAVSRLSGGRLAHGDLSARHEPPRNNRPDLGHGWLWRHPRLA
ncbi:hypothetical protein [Candidatus Amarobacter glycogenicus]|uniref:hypothetical protein n=1 Tax=Candidatus Amarobacter glycogenicus TaxID=3140699 RepID=UPI0031CCCE7D